MQLMSDEEKKEIFDRISKVENKVDTFIEEAYSKIEEINIKLKEIIDKKSK